MKQWRTAGILAVVVLSLAGLVTWDEWQTEQDEQAEAGKDLMLDVDSELVTKIEYQDFAADSEQPKVVLEKDADNQWRVIEPLSYAGDAKTIGDLLSTLKKYKFEKLVVDDATRWKDFGLDKPARRISVHAKDQVQTLIVGATSPVGYSVYSALEGSSQVYLGSQHLLISSAKTLFDFRSKQFLQIPYGQVTSLNYLRKGQKPVRLAMQDMVFRVTEPESLKADQGLIRDLLANLNELKVEKFIDTDDKPLRLFDSPLVSVSWMINGENKVTNQVDFARDGQSLFAARLSDGMIVKVSSDVEKSILKELYDFRDKRVLAFESGDVSEVIVDGESFINVKGDWHPKKVAEKFSPEGEWDANKGQIPQEKQHIRALIVDLAFAKAETFHPVNQVPKSAPLHVVELRFDEGSKKSPITAKFYSIEGDQERVHVEVSGAEDSYEVSASVLTSIAEGEDSASASNALESGSDSTNL